MAAEIFREVPSHVVRWMVLHGCSTHRQALGGELYQTEIAYLVSKRNLVVLERASGLGLDHRFLVPFVETALKAGQHVWPGFR